MITVGHYGIDGACAPRESSGPTVPFLALQETFSVGIFQLIPKRSGAGTKRGKVVVRVKGPTSHPDEVWRRARQIAEDLDAGICTGPKTVDLRTS